MELKNLYCQSISHLYYELGKSKERLRHKSNVILGRIKQPGFEPLQVIIAEPSGSHVISAEAHSVITL